MNVTERPVVTGCVALCDSGLQSGAINFARDRHDWARHACGELGDQLRFHRSLPTAAIGRYQVIDRELRIEHCEQAGIAMVRRCSGGGALYLDPDQLCWSLLLHQPPGWESVGQAQLLALFASALAAGLQHLGADAHYKYPNDVEIGGRKLASLFIGRNGSSLLVQGVILLDANIRTMLEVLRAPTEKLSRDGLSAARERLITLRQCLGEDIDVQRVRSVVVQGLATLLGRNFGGMTADAGERRLPPQWQSVETEELWRLDWRTIQTGGMEALWKTAGGTLRVRARENAAGQLDGVELAGDIHIEPAGWLPGLQDALQATAPDAAPAVALAYARRHVADMPGFGAEDIARLLAILADKRRLQREIGLDNAQTNALMLYTPRGQAPGEILGHATVMLVPYCAKPAWCKWRMRDGCPECGLCEVGEAYRLARERGMQVTTIMNYEHLERTLGDMKARGVPAYIGMCCSSFFIKRHRAFQQAGLPAMLMDISGSNCYELKQEELAYAGKFEAQATLDVDALRKVIRLVPVASPVTCESSGVE